MVAALTLVHALPVVVIAPRLRRGFLKVGRGRAAGQHQAQQRDEQPPAHAWGSASCMSSWASSTPI